MNHPKINFTKVFTYAVRNGHLEMAKDIYNVYPITGLCTYGCFRDACIRGHLDVVKWLVQVNPSLKIDIISFGYACKRGNLELAKWMIGYNPYIVPTSIEFHDVSKLGHLEFAKWLLEMEPTLIDNATKTKNDQENVQ